MISFKKTNKLTYFFCISLYIHGGRDIKVGPLSSMWRLSIAGVEDLKIHKDAGVQWEHVSQKGTIPGNLSHHKAVNFGHSAVVFGGIQNNDDCLEAFEFDTTKMQWSKLK